MIHSESSRHLFSTRVCYQSMIYTQQFFDWINDNINADPAALRLKYAGREMPFDVAAAILQIESRRKYAKKLADTLTAFPDFIFPDSLSGEQSTSDLLAEFHASLVPAGTTVVDLTGGLGIDALHIARKAASVTVIERKEELVEALKYNAAGLGVKNITAVHGDCREFAAKAIASGARFDVAFIDPARRSSDGSRVWALEGCEPDVVAMLPELSKLCRKLIIKASPMLDISHTIAELNPRPAEVIALGTSTECKELMAVVDFNENPQEDKVIIRAVTLTRDQATDFSFTRHDETTANALPASAPTEGGYIYEPYPAVMKAGGAAILSQDFGVSPFHANTRLFHSIELKRDFPGQILKIIRVLPYASKHIKRFRREYPRISVTARNFGMTADALRAKLGVSDGGTLRLFGVTDYRGERILIVGQGL